MNNLDEAIRTALKAAYERGLADGRKLLGQLARGEITVGEFEKR